MGIELEKSSQYWWEKSDRQFQKIVGLCDTSPSRVLAEERALFSRMCEQMERYRTAERRERLKKFYNI